MWGKPFVTNIEGEFKTDKLRDKHVFHDVNLRASDPEEFRATSIDYLRGLGYIIDVNEMTEFEDDAEFDKFFRGGRLKPLKNIIKARGSTTIGSRFPVAWKLLLLTGIVSLIGYLMPYDELNRDFLFYLMVSSFIISGILYLIKKVIISSIWVKMIGVYDIEGVRSDIRVVISADTSESDLRIFDKLRDDVAEFYNLISKRYIKKPGEGSELIKPATKSRTDELLTRLSKISSDIRELESKFINGRVNEDVFKKLMQSLENEKSKLETVIDLVNV